MRIGTIILSFFFSTPLTFAQKIDTVYVNEKSSVVLIFSDRFSGELGNNDYEVTPKENTIKIKAKTKNPIRTFLGIDVRNGDRFYFILVYRETLPRIIYEYKPIETKGVEVTEKKIVINSLDESLSESEEVSDSSTSEDLLYKALAEVARDNTVDLKRYGFAVTNNRMIFKLVNVFAHKELFVFKLEFINESSLDFNFSFFDITIEEKMSLRKSKAERSDRFEIVFQDPPQAIPVRIASGEKKEFIVITDTENYKANGKMRLVINERNNKRSLSFEMDSKYLLKAEKINL